MIDLRSHTHSNGWASEVEAFEKALKSANSIKLQILEELDRAGALKGLTPDEFVEMHGGLINTVRRRFTDLWKEGKIRHHPQSLTRKNSSGNACVAWVLGYDPSAYQKRAKREWQGLTDEEIKEIIGPWGGGPIKGYTRELIDKIEAKLKEKNSA
jgi:hypothetical protein